MAISGIDSSGGLSALQAAVNAAKKVDASAATPSASAAKKPGGNPPSGAGRPPSGAAKSSSSTASVSQTYDDADANEDGVVTALEQLTYDMQHPGEQTGTKVDVRA